MVSLALEDGCYMTTLTTKYENRKAWVNPVEGEIKAHLPGTILDVSVEVDQAVRKGDLLLIHEAMKMKNRVLAPIDGTIADLLVATGDKVKKDAVLVVIKPA